jgi:hypothetical protein
VIFIATFVSHMRQHRLVASPSLSAGGMTADGKATSQLLASIFHIAAGEGADESRCPLMDGDETCDSRSPSPAAPAAKSAKSAVGQAVQSTAMKRPSAAAAAIDEQQGFSPREGDAEFDPNAGSVRRNADDDDHRAPSSPSPREAGSSSGAARAAAATATEVYYDDADDGEDDVEHLSRSASLSGQGRSLRLREIRLKEEPDRLWAAGSKADGNSAGNLEKVASSLDITF